VFDLDGTIVPGNPAQSIANAASSAGDFLYRFGCPANYNNGSYPSWGTNGNQQTWGEHNVQWIKATEYAGGPALPGEGNLLIFNNGGTNNNSISAYSTILEISPYISGMNGTTPIIGSTYVDPPAAGYNNNANNNSSLNGFGQANLSNQIVWRYQPQSPTEFNSQYMSGMDRLPNGNTFICSAQQGHFLEVTSSGALAWEYMNPIFDTKGIAYRYQHDENNFSGDFVVYRAHRTSVNHPALKNHIKQLPDGRILPVIMQQGDGYTLSGAAPCTNVPCNSGTSIGGF
jgi:hypothetical protein